MSVRSISVAQVVKTNQRILWIDARTEAEFEKEHLPDAVSLTPLTWETALPEIVSRWDPSMIVIVYGYGPADNSASQVAGRLARELGIASIHVFNGDWRSRKAPP